MLKFINLKKLTAKTLFGILIISSFITQAGTAHASKKVVVGACSDQDNGHGNNMAASVILSSGKVITVAKYDSTNPGKSKEDQLKSALKNGQTSSNGMDFTYGGNPFNLADSDAQFVLDNIPDIERDCDEDVDGFNNGIEEAIDTDGDGIFDYADPDSDNDGKLDSVEGNADKNNNSVLDRLEANGITVSIEAPKIQTTQLPNSSQYFVVDFNDQATGTAGFNKTNNGNTYKYSSDLDIRTANEWGGAGGSKFITQANKATIRSYNIKIDQDQKYFGFWWSAGDPFNQITFKKDGNEVAVFKTKDLVDFINSSGVSNKTAYYGNPAYSGSNTGHKNEPFSFVNIFFNDQKFDEIVVATQTAGGSAFESDNHTFSAMKQSIRGNVIHGVTPDADYDGLIDSADPEPNNPDIDNDGLLDGNDKYRTDPDHDKDGLIDGQDPNYENPDTDGDGLKDGEDPNPKDSNGDADSDGLSDAKEMKPPTGTPVTNPRNADTDNDGLKDGEEVNPPAGKYKSDPTKIDTDSDTINDKDESTKGTDPNKVDTDGDGLRDNNPKDPDPTKYDTDDDLINDGWEEIGKYKEGGDAYKLLPNGTVRDVDGDGIPNNQDTDSDNDGLSDRVEMNRTTNNPFKQDVYTD
jgi:hypothetical protein